MPAKSLTARLTDILEAIEGIRDGISGVDYDNYVASWVIRRAVERGIEIISEASRHIPAAHMTEWSVHLNRVNAPVTLLQWHCDQTRHLTRTCQQA